MLPATNHRVEQHTHQAINESIARETQNRIAHYSTQPPQVISRRILELNQEWDIERALECNASALAFSGVLLSATVDKRWLLLPGLVTGFLFQHALQGWCPPLPILRRMGFRTSAEINEERYALKALRGDFERIISRDGIHADPDAAFVAADQ
ncbi:hypothetical protein [Allorhodopirellula heiligendammensis]|uniref:DUF2892 domain-containing protein n=1 Tax=Allorhodopirellula heiligendammensis TaxID=2714739 RepID=A0A5C6BW37_9BACT|nr:hypothetical protein [Allorhodopirellula heiligendammensis]TWU15651.1 hypothetical protein Poly21_28480 [Allorhodopirellula heiligendammensis]